MLSDFWEDDLSVLQKHFCSMLWCWRKREGLGGALWSGHFCEGQPLWKTLSTHQERSCTELGCGRRHVSEVSLKGMETGCTVHDVHDICSFVSG